MAVSGSNLITRPQATMGLAMRHIPALFEELLDVHRRASIRRQGDRQNALLQLKPIGDPLSPSSAAGIRLHPDTALVVAAVR